MFRRWAAAVKFADEMNTWRPLTTTALACRQARSSHPTASERALIGILMFTAARVGAVAKLRIRDL